MRYKLSPTCKSHRTDVVSTTQFCMIVIQRRDNMDFEPVKMNKRIRTHEPTKADSGGFEPTT